MASTKSPPGFDKRNKKKSGGVIEEKVEQSGNWPQHACTTKIFLILLKNVTSERPFAFMPNV